MGGQEEGETFICLMRKRLLRLGESQLWGAFGRETEATRPTHTAAVGAGSWWEMKG